MIHEILRVGPLKCNCSILGDEASREAIVVDPGDDISDVKAVLEKHSLQVSAIVITHAHIDHIGGAQKLRNLTVAPVFMNPDDQFLTNMLDVQAAWIGVETPEKPPIDRALRDGETVVFGPATATVLHTPGHTPGSLCLWMPSQQKLIAGDTLFRESVGRTDLPGGDDRKIISSIREKLMQLPEETIVIPGHGAPTTIAHEKAFNPFLQG